MCVSRFSQGVYKEVVYKAFTICVLQGFYNVFDTSFTMFVYEVFTMSFAGALQDCYNALEGISKDFKLFLESLYEDFRRLLQVVCPTGLVGVGSGSTSAGCVGSSPTAVTLEPTPAFQTKKPIICEHNLVVHSL